MELIKELEQYIDPRNILSAKRFFKTGKGDYSENDQFIGISIPNLRKVGKKYYKTVDLDMISTLLKSKYNEYRYLALIFLGNLYSETNDKQYVKYYLNNLKYVNNWNLVDVSAAPLLGKYLYDNNISSKILFQYARSKNLWLKRIAIVATLYFIRRDYFKDTFDLAVILFNDSHNLVYKAAGWMLREVGKRDRSKLLKFLDRYHREMPRIMLSYSIEHLSELQKKKYRKKKLCLY